MEFSKEHQRHAILFLYQKGVENAEEVQRQLSFVFGDSTLAARTIRDWLNKFRSRDFSLEDEPRAGRPVELDDNALLALVRDNPRLNTREMGEQLGCDYTTVARHLSQLDFVKKLGAWIPHRLREDQLEQRVTICNSLLSRSRRFDWLRNIVTGDEKWVMYFNPNRRGQWVLRGEEPEPEPKPELHEKKIMLSVFWDYKGIIWMELLKPETTVNADVYCAQLDGLRRAHAILRPERERVLLLHDNARPHVALQTRTKIVDEFGWEILPHPPYSPDIAPSDFHLFRHLSNYLRGKQFSKFEDLNSAVRSYLNSLSEDFFAKGIDDLPKRWTYIVDNDGAYYI